MNAFNRLPGFRRSPPGLEHRLWQRLPAIWAWGTLLPLLGIAANHLIAPGSADAVAVDGQRLMWDFALIGAVILHGTLVLTVAIGCFIVRVMKGPAYVADGYPMPGAAVRGGQEAQPMGPPPAPGGH